MQEISTKYLINKRYRDGSNIPQCDNKRRICKDAVEDVQRIISSFPLMSSRYYLPMRHGIVAKASSKIEMQIDLSCKSKIEYSNIKMRSSGGIYTLERQQTSNTLNLTYLFGIIKIASVPL